MNEGGLLYGWRAVDDGRSYSFSMGLSYASFWQYADYVNGQRYEHRERYAGVPFEAGVLWFKARKEPLKLYGVVPVGGRTGLGSSFGLKFFGALSRNPYAGLGLSYGVGWHRKY